MRFKPFGRYEFNDTGRKRAASRRKLQAELRTIAIRQDALLARDEKRKWKLLAADAKTRSRPR